ncbi:hypothetical protein CH296_00365 [Rhodococcus sp. 14-2496-1d]|uniref:hypothetical protein n=1 Tax=Rhodococcus sp. 14-2496-1d TaxID=2023146 RepID=UPI000B9BFD84|nr:hypothetical protein [Rhodococcus sp. 14-2496-1d]OZF40745.1 hypothetical protein CH296_00365 [Rhodococcus sp. 14-2496-1d]
MYSAPIFESAKVEIQACDNGRTWNVHGVGQGAQGVYLGQDQVKGLYDAPTSTTWVSSPHQSGGSMKRRKRLVRDLMLGFHLSDDRTPAKWGAIDSAFRQAFDYREDDWDPDSKLARIDYTSEQSGLRMLDVQLYEQPDFDPGVDPNVQGYSNPVIPLRAGQPFWYEDPVTTMWSTTGSSGSGFIEVSNPTDIPMAHKWILTRGDWILPDQSWTGPKGKRVPGTDKLRGRDDSTRKIIMPPITSTNGGAIVDLDPKELMVRDAHDTNLLGQMPVPGRYFQYVIPPYTTEPVQLPVSVTNAPAGGAMCQLVQPRLWSRCQGMELAL